MKNLTIDIYWNVPAKVIYNALLSDFEMMKCTRGPVILQPKVDGEFSFYDGKVQGKYISLEQNKCIKQKWKFKEWNSYSDVEIIFIDYPEDEECDMKIKQTNIPQNVDIENLRNGWHSQILEPFRIICGYPKRNDN